MSRVRLPTNVQEEVITMLKSTDDALFGSATAPGILERLIQELKETDGAPKTKQVIQTLQRMHSEARSKIPQDILFQYHKQRYDVNLRVTLQGPKSFLIQE
jgi:hypothetical protein